MLVLLLVRKLNDEDSRKVLAKLRSIAGSSRAGFSLIELLIVIGISSILIGLIAAGVQQVRSRAKCTECTNQMRQIGLALHQYHDGLGLLPPGLQNNAVKTHFPYMSWLVRILPYLENESMWVRSVQAYGMTSAYSESPPHLFSVPMRAYGCPSDGRTLEPGTFYSSGIGKQVGLTSYLGVEGLNQTRKGGLLFVNSSIRFVDITDGMSNTLMIGERPPSSDEIYGWWYAAGGQADDGSLDQVMGVKEINVMLRAECSLDSSQFGPGQAANVCDALHFWSLHSGGSNFVFADGSGRFITYAGVEVMPALASRAGGETTTLP